jgi:hypothetical protein
MIPLTMFARAAVLLLAFLPSLPAHVLSISNGELAVDGVRAQYQLRMPVYETPHIRDPRDLLRAVRFFARGEEARRSGERCEQRAADGVIVCETTLEFSFAPERLEVECLLHSITVPNHVHLLRASRGSGKDQAAFDLSFTRAELRFVPPSGFELGVKHTAAGAMRMWGGIEQWLFLLTLAVAARGRREWAALVGSFLAGLVLSAVITRRSGWEPAPQFVESAMALTVAYLAVEVLALPKGGYRWLIAAVLGVFHGWYFSLFLVNSGYPAAPVLAGASAAAALPAGLFAWGLAQAGRLLPPPRVAQALAGLLVCAGLGWFFLRLGSG